MTPEEQKAHEIRKEAQEIEAREKLNAWLELDIVKERFRTMEKERFDEFRAADTDDKRTAAWHRSRALQDLLNEIKGVQASGKLAQQRQDNRREQEARAARNPRK
jgi:hypothetical protein